MEEYDDCSWQDTYKVMGCEIPYEDDYKPEEIEDLDIQDEFIVPITAFPNQPRPEPKNPYLPDITPPEFTPFDAYEPSFTIVGI